MVNHYHAVLGPEAKEFIFALQKLILDTIGSSSDVAIADEGISSSKDNASMFDKHLVPVTMTRTPTLSEIFGDIDLVLNPLAMDEGDHDRPTKDVETSPSEKVQGKMRAFNGQAIPTMTIGPLQTQLNRYPFSRKRDLYAPRRQVRAQFSEPHFMANIRMAPSIQIRLEEEWYSIEEWISAFAKYAILSHTWIHAAPGEITYDHWNKKQYARGPERDYGVTLGWMDTVCINKESSAELDESIRSMFKWYRDASICLTHELRSVVHPRLDVAGAARPVPLQILHRTLGRVGAWRQRQVQSADPHADYSSDIDHFNRTSQFLPEDVTAGGVVYRKDGYSGISRRMEWAARRRVTREEDQAYSLMGLFNVSMSIAYGEGAERAFLRLLKKILAASTYNSDMFNWAADRRGASSASVTFRNPSSLLPTRLQDYLQRAKVPLGQGWTVEPILFSHLGLRLQVLLAPAVLAANPNAGYRAIGDYACQAKIACVDQDASALYDGTYNLLDEDLFSSRISRQRDSSVSFHVSSIAVALYCKEPPGMVSAQGRPKRIHTKEPIICAFENTEDHHLKGDILMSDLAEHGLQLVTFTTGSAGLATNPDAGYRAIWDYACQAKIACVDRIRTIIYATERTTLA
ncbi:hypothetical protein BJ912DRAFT_1038848 [Pholiota molesta]|nr:hypothetical protein BJ912DRAFT_1038848 [Pholiota molesta]